LTAVALSLAQPPKSFEFKDGDRIVWLGGTLVEREQRYGYWETALYAAHPDKTITLRNLGWSGDTVWGESRGRFDFADANKCFRQLVDQTLALKPTVIFVSYGQNESFEGEAGLAKFETGLNKLLDALKPANARVVLFSPADFYTGLRVADFQTRSEMLGRYAKVVEKVAEARGAWFADLRSKTMGHSLPITDNGVHPSEEGYRLLSYNFLQVLGYRSEDRPDWMKLEPLRQAVIEKNQLFFHRWRPQNETYLFGFRKHEQGKNAKEVAEFDPLVSKAEEEIAKIRKTLLK
jgi:lysophospholipase L1-like esterase